MPAATTIDSPTARALVRLRYALEHAIALPRDLTEPGAHIAIVALDGAVEQALWLVSRWLGVQLRQFHTHHELVSKLHSALNAGTGQRWVPAGAASVDQLHRARNDAQHAGRHASQGRADQARGWLTAGRGLLNLP